MDKTINGVESYPCPWCGYYDLLVQKNGMKNVQHPGGECFVMCDNCGATGPKAKTVDEAIQKWNDCSEKDVNEETTPHEEGGKTIVTTFVQTIRGIKYRITLDDEGEVEIAEIKTSSLADTYAQLNADKEAPSEDKAYVLPLPCVRDEHGVIKEQTVKQLLQKINEELDELKQALFIRKYFLDMDEHVAEEAADVKTAITTLEEALGIDVAMRDEAIRRVNAKNRERGRL